MPTVGPYERRYVVHRLRGLTVRGEKLLAKRYRDFEVPLSTMFAVDELLGDDEFVFLGETRYPPPFASGAYVFDAEELIRDGALLRLGDVLKTVEFIRLSERYVRLSKSQYPSRESLMRVGVTREELRRLIETDPEMARLFADLLRVRGELTLSGEEALGALRDGRCGG